MPAQNTGNSEMQSALSAGNSKGDNHGEENLQGVQTEVSQEVNTNGEEAGVVWEAIANIDKKGYNSYPRTIDGEYFI